MSYIIKKYIGEDYRDSLTKNRLYKIHSEDEDDIYVYDNSGFIERCDLDNFRSTNKKEYKSFIIQDTQQLFNDCLKRIKEIDDFICSNDPYYTFSDSNEQLENKLSRIREENVELQKLSLYYEMILKFFNIEEVTYNE